MKKLSVSTCAPEKLNKQKTKELSSAIKKDISKYQKVLYAEGERSILIVLQGVDASGKDGLISDVFSGLNPFGVNVAAFKSPSKEELSHDFLWRIHQECPARGMIHIFNRSHYEDILVPRVNKLLDERTLLRRMRDINHFERMLVNEGTTILKFYLHVSREEQAIRLRERKTNPEKFWKHNDDDWKARRKWTSYMETYELIFKHCNEIPWQIIPADQNWYKEYLVAVRVRDTLRKMKLKYPTQEAVAAKNGK
jgi:PPK2 family polyphosphate:nucleotide phosphotransferase